MDAENQVDDRLSAIILVASTGALITAGLWIWLIPDHFPTIIYAPATNVRPDAFA